MRVAVLISFGILAVMARAQVVQVGPDDPNYCDNVEKIRPNLILAKEAHVFGRVTDEAGGPFDKQKIELRTFVSQKKQMPERSVVTDSTGKFDLGKVKKGQYRLLLSATRGFKQAELLDCYAQGECELNVKLAVNPTDMPASMCLVK